MSLRIVPTLNTLAKVSDSSDGVLYGRQGFIQYFKYCFAAHRRGERGARGGGGLGGVVNEGFGARPCN